MVLAKGIEAVWTAGVEPFAFAVASWLATTTGLLLVVVAGDVCRWRRKNMEWTSKHCKIEEIAQLG